VVNFEDMHRRCSAILAAAGEEAWRAELLQLQSDLAALRDAERGNGERVRFREFLFDLFVGTLRTNGILRGVIAEIGGSKNSFLSRLPDYEARFLSLLPATDSRVIVADVTNCPQVPDASFDAIFSLSVLEHVTHIHDAAREITRLLKPGGITMHAVPFSYFFHGAPVDYWRVTTTAMSGLFEELETIDCFFYSHNRRRNNLGSDVNPVDQDGGALFAPDAFGGWRENWFTIYIGRKLPDGAWRLQQKRQRQVLMDLTKGLQEWGVPEGEAVVRALQLSRHVGFGRHGRVEVSKEALRESPGMDAQELSELWKRRGRNTVRPSVGRHNLMAMLGAAGLA
jgi:SAM-dependent methyltransferase